MVPPCFIRINVKLAVKELSVAIASAAEPGAAGRHHQPRGDRKRGAAGCSGSPPSAPWRSQARRSRAQRVATIKPRGDRKRGAAARSGSPPSNPVAIASAAQPRAAGRHHQTPWRSQARRSRAQRVATSASRAGRRRMRRVRKAPGHRGLHQARPASPAPQVPVERGTQCRPWPFRPVW